MPRTARYLGLAFANSDLLLEVDPDGMITFVAGAVHALTGQDDGDLLRRPVTDILAGADRRLVSRLLRELKDNQRLGPRIIHVHHPVNGDIPCLLGAYRVSGRSDISVTFTRLAQHMINPPDQVAGIDRETGLSDRDSFQRHIKAGLGADEGSRRLTLIKLERLQSMCSSLGPAGAGELMGEIGAVLRQYVAVDAAVSRLGIDRFGMLHTDDFVAEVTREIDAVIRSLAPDAGEPSVKTSTLDTHCLGLSMSDRTRILLHVIRSFAEQELVSLDLQAGSVLVSSIVKETVNQMMCLRDDLDARRIRVVYQPIIDLKTGRGHHLEALARHPDGSSYASSVIFSEQIGVATELDMFVCQAVLRDLRKAPAECQVAVNLSGYSIESDLFVQTLLELLRSCPDERARVLFELTETIGLKDIPRASRVINELRAAGHAVCLDDFGAGAASFSYLRDFKFDYVKLDGAYVRNLGRSERDDALLGSMIKTCHQMKVRTIAEHVETVEQAVRLRTMRCEYAQGWLFEVGGSHIQPYRFDMNVLSQPGQRYKGFKGN